MKLGRKEKAYKMINKFFGKYNYRFEGIEDRYDRIIYELTDIAVRQNEYLEILREGKILEQNKIYEEEYKEETNTVIQVKFYKALKNLKNGKAACIDSIEGHALQRLKYCVFILFYVTTFLNV